MIVVLKVQDLKSESSLKRISERQKKKNPTLPIYNFVVLTQLTPNPQTISYFVEAVQTQIGYWND